MKAIFAAAAKDLSLVPMLRDPFVLTPGFEGPKQPPGNKPLFDEDLGMWAGAVRDGEHQHPQRASLQYFAEFSLRPRLHL